MIERLDIIGIHADVDADLHKYVVKKIGALDRYMPRHSRRTAHAEVRLKEAKAKDKKQCTCEVVLHLPHGTLTVKESTINMFAAVDIVETKLKNQLKKHKEKHSSPHIARRLYNKLRKAEVS